MSEGSELRLESQGLYPLPSPYSPTLFLASLPASALGVGAEGEEIQEHVSFRVKGSRSDSSFKGENGTKSQQSHYTQR